MTETARWGRLWLLPALLLSAACNMAISETPMFDAAEPSQLAPRDGVWLSHDRECRFDPQPPESRWPECALWVVVRNAGGELHVSDGNGQSQRLVAVFAAGSPAIVQGEWNDDAKEPSSTHFGFYGLEPGPTEADGRFVTARAWPVECGVQDKPGSDIRPFPGIGLDCRPESRDAIRSAAAASHRADHITEWRWLRAEGSGN